MNGNHTAYSTRVNMVKKLTSGVGGDYEGASSVNMPIPRIEGLSEVYLTYHILKSPVHMFDLADHIMFKRYRRLECNIM
jgi:ribulose kinase